MNYDMISKTEANELEHCLRWRRLTKTGKDEELVTRAFVAIKNDAILRRQRKKMNYTFKLVINIISDQFQPTFGWLAEASVVRYWPTKGLEASEDLKVVYRSNFSLPSQYVLCKSVFLTSSVYKHCAVSIQYLCVDGSRTNDI